MITMYKGLTVALLLCSGLFADQQGDQHPKDWQDLRGKNLAAGCPSELVDQTLGACRKHGMSVEQADRLMEAVFAAQAEHLPVECIFERIEEGLAKKADLEQIIAASNARLEHLREAQALIFAILSGTAEKHGDGQTRLLVNISMALESGLPEDMLKAVLLRNGHRRLGRMAHVVEVGESLYLAGLEPAQVQRIMTDCLDRNLNRHEMMRAAKVLQDGIASGSNFESVYAELWISGR